MAALIHKQDTLFDITEQFPRTIDVLRTNGFTAIADRDQREHLGKAVTLEAACAVSGRDVHTLLQLLEEAARQDFLEHRVWADGEGGKPLRIMGLLPCPVRIPLTEKLEAFAAARAGAAERPLTWDLQAAYVGTQWLSEHVTAGNPDALPHVFISAGFDMFFDPKRIGGLREAGVFKDLTGFSPLNPDFESAGMADPAGHYGLLGAVPAVFLVNGAELGGRRLPESWEDVLDPVFRDSLSLPVGDFDLFNGIMLAIHKRFGDEGLRRLRTNLLDPLHPSQMVKSASAAGPRPAITIMPYFFTRTIREGGPMVPVWPEDGAIVTPIFLLSRADTPDVEEVVSFFASREIGQTLAHTGLFPSAHPEVDNRLPEGARFQWIGWDYLYANDIGAAIEHCQRVFDSAAQGAFS